MKELKLFEEVLQGYGALKPGVPAVIRKLNATIPSEVPENLKIGINLTLLSWFVTQTRNNILFEEGSSPELSTYVPCNVLSFNLAPSGVSKDRTLKTVTKVLDKGLKHFEGFMKKDLIKRAKEKSTHITGNDKSFIEYLERMPSISFKFGTSAAAIDEISHIGNKVVIGAPLLTSSEIGSDLSTRGDQVAGTFTVLSEIYDTGDSKFPILKDKTQMAEDVKGLPVSCLVFGSEQGLLLNSSNKAKFREMFEQQLARRTIFTFSDYTPKEEKYTSKEELLRSIAEQKSEDTEAKVLKEELSKKFELLAKSMKFNTPIRLEDGVKELFNIYKAYNEVLADTYPLNRSTSRLARLHKQWVALKVSGVLALAHGKQNISTDIYAEAINLIELLEADLFRFEEEMNKEPYQVLYDYIRGNGIDSISLHELAKLGFVKSTNAKNQAKALIDMLNSLSKDMVFAMDENGKMEITQIAKAKGVSLSFKPINSKHISEAYRNGTSADEIREFKHKLAYQSTVGFKVGETAFKDLEHLLSKEFAYIPFKLREVGDPLCVVDPKHKDATGGIRNMENIYGPTSFLVLDVDDSKITMSEAHDLLEGINHFIAPGSNPDNEFKFRIIVELANELDLPNNKWKKFLALLEDEIGIKFDHLPKSQVYYSYGSDKVLGSTDGEPLDVSSIIKTVLSEEEPKPLSSAVKSKLLKDPRGTFDFAFNASNGSGSLSLMKAAYYARKLGADKAYIIELMYSINEDWINPMDINRLKATIIAQIERW